MTRRRSERKKGGAAKRTTAISAEWFLTRENAPWILFLVAITIVAYQPAWNAGYIWDDDVYVTGNQLLTASDGLWRIWFSLDSPSQYFPLVYTTFRFEHALWGLNPAGYHLVNILLHATNALLVWRLLARFRIPGAWLAAALFALHPVQVESVAWITERKNVLMGLFFLLSLIHWARFIENKNRSGAYWLALIFYTLALFSKTTACTLPAALLLMLWLERRPIDGRRLLQIVPFIVVGIALGLVTIWWERYHQGTQGQLFALGIPERLLVASRAVWFYLWKLIWPANLAFSYQRWSISARNVLDYAWLAAAMVLAAALWFWRPRATRAITVAALFFVTTLGPVLGFIMLYTFRYSFVADHYQYLACIGPIALAGAGLAVTSDRLQLSKTIQWVAVAVLLGTISVMTWNQCRIYSDAKTLWQETLARNPASWMAHANLGVILFQQGKVEEGIEHYNKALELDPTYGEAHYNLANAFVRLGRTEEAISHYEKAIDFSPLNARAHFNLGSILVQNKRVDEGIAHFRQALVLSPRDAGIHNNLGIALLRSDKIDEAAAEFRNALGLNPENAEANYNLANALVQKGRLEEAVSYYEKAGHYNPRNAAVHERLSEVLRRLNRLDEAESHARQAAELRRAR